MPNADRDERIARLLLTGGVGSGQVVQPVTLPPELSRSCRCPTCGGSLGVIRSVDPWAVCFACTAGHRFSIEPDVASSDSAQAAAAQFPELDGESSSSVARFWITDPRARGMLNAQLAQLLRAVLDDRAASTRLAFTYCPLCGEALCEADERRCEVVRCSNQHVWQRGPRVLLSDGIGEPFMLWAEYEFAAISRLVALWLQSDDARHSNVHESVRRALLESRFASSDTS
jgi:hypothetical protein